MTYLMTQFRLTKQQADENMWHDSANDRRHAMYTYATLNDLYDIDTGSRDAYDYMEAFVDHIPQNLEEALQAFELASSDLHLDIEPVWKLTKKLGRTTEGLVALRRLEREAASLDGGSVPPVRYEARVLKSLIAWMSQPVVLGEPLQRRRAHLKGV